MATATATAVPCSFSASGVIRGYYVYQRIWTPHVGEKATMVKEPGNKHNRSTSNAVMKSKYATAYNVQFLPGTATLHTNILLARFPRYWKRSIFRELVEALRNTHFHPFRFFFTP